MTKALLQDTTVIEANQFPIKSVKLFSSCSAEITRTFPLSFLRSQDGPQVVEIINLPASLLSVDVSVTSTSGNVTILDHYHTAGYHTAVDHWIDHIPDSPSMVWNRMTPDHHYTSVAKNPAPSSQTLRDLETERLRLEDERRLRQQSSTFLTTYMDSLAQCKSNSQPEAAQMVSFFDDFVEIGVTRSAVISELVVKLADVGNRITEEKERLSKLSRDLPVKVVTVLSCNNQVPLEAVELTLTYVVLQVSWKPAYDLHIAMTGNIPSRTVKLDFRCKVTQWTGENWENVSLALTTADQVSQLIQLPQPKRIDIGLGQTHIVPQPVLAPWQPWPTVAIPGARMRSRMAGPQSKEVERDRNQGRGREIQRAGDDVPAVQLPPPHELSLARPALRQMPRRIDPFFPPPPPTPVVDEAPTVTVDAPSLTVSQLISHGSKDPITHIANGCIFVPSDNAEHHVMVTSLSLQGEFMRVVVPSTDTRVYYTCEVKNTNESVLLPGTVKVYLNGKHVSSTDIHNTELPQILECSLAVDTGVKIIHNRAPDALPSFGAFTGKATTTYTSATVIHNTHAEPIRGVIVRSSIPLPTDPRITIVLKEPAGLAEMDEGSVSVKEGCLARWSAAGGRKGKQAGLFEWVCNVNPGTEVLKAVWEVCAPQDLKLFEQVRS